jgi:hypothetical protein
MHAEAARGEHADESTVTGAITVVGATDEP